jgi:DNA-binding transcriptional ArsR family regulator
LIFEEEIGMAEVESNLVELFKVLADQSRLNILYQLKSGEKNPTSLQNALQKGQSTISQQLKILMQANLITMRQEGINKFYRIKDPQLFTVLQTIENFLARRQLDQVEAISSSDVREVLF